MKPLLDLTDVNYTYQTAEGETPAVKNLSFRVFPDHFPHSETGDRNDGSDQSHAENRQFYP